MYKLLASKTITGAEFQADVDPDVYDEFMLRVTGTQAGANFIAIGEVGRVFYRHGKDPLVDADFDMLHFMNELLGGDVECTGEANGAAFAFACIIPRGLRDLNVEDVRTGDKAQVVLRYGPNVISHIASGTVELYGHVKAFGVQTYALELIQHNIDLSTSSRYRLPVPADNVAAIFTDRGFGVNNITPKASLTVDANFTEMAIKKDGEEGGSIPVGVLQAWSNHRNRIEGTYTRMFEQRLASEGQLLEAYSDDVVVTTVTDGAAVVRHLVASMRTTPDRRNASVDLTNQTVRTITNRKAVANKSNDLAVLRQLAVEETK